jgi:hypothetical protein
LRLPEPLLGARGTSPLLDGWLEGIAPRPACTLDGAARPRVTALAADVLSPAVIADPGVRSPAAVTGIGDPLPAVASTLLPTAGMGDLPPAAGVGDLRPTVGVGDLLPAAGVGDLLSAVVAGVFSIITCAGLFSPTVNAEVSMPARCWIGRGLPATSVSKSSDSEKSTPAGRGALLRGCRCLLPSLLRDTLSSRVCR